MTLFTLQWIYFTDTYFVIDLDKHGSADAEKIKEYFHGKTESETARLWVSKIMILNSC